MDRRTNPIFDFNNDCAVTGSDFHHFRLRLVVSVCGGTGSALSLWVRFQNGIVAK